MKIEASSSDATVQKQVGSDMVVARDFDLEKVSIFIDCGSITRYEDPLRNSLEVVQIIQWVLPSRSQDRDRNRHSNLG
jgi:hypothetical protein